MQDGNLNFRKKLFELYELLQDDLSRDIFWLRLQHDASPTIDTAFNLIGLMEDGEAHTMHCWTKIFDVIAAENKKLLLYGTGSQGKEVARNILDAGRDFLGFCTRNSERYPSGIMGKPVLPPQKLLEQADDYYVIISTSKYYEEVYQYLCENDFPPSHILLHGKTAKGILNIIERQYFDFPEFFKPGSAFVDGGCFDSKDSIKFSEWSRGRYSKIFAFEPDHVNIEKCKENAEKHQLTNFELIEAGLGSKPTEMLFASSENDRTGSRFMTDKMSDAALDFVRLTTIDRVVGNAEVGFIKLDIEGFELAALQGASGAIIRDRPLLAICVYHKRGDLLAAMEYLHGLLPEYRFWVRHYSIGQNETVLYAAVPDLRW